MIDLEKQAREGFRLENGRIYNQNGVTTLEYNVGLTEFGWSSPCTEYHFNNYEYNEYSIQKEVHYDKWYLYKGYRKICELYHLGGKTFKTTL